MNCSDVPALGSALARSVSPSGGSAVPGAGSAARSERRPGTAVTELRHRPSFGFLLRSAGCVKQGKGLGTTPLSASLE